MSDVPADAAAAGPPSTTERAPSPVRELLGERNFRRFFVSQVFHAGVNGTLRFAFIWLIVTLTDWPSAEGLVALALGLPAMFFSAPAGAWSDRVDRKQMFVRWTVASTVALAAFTVVIAVGAATPLVAGVAALVIGTVTTVNFPNIQAMVPLLVPRDRLMNAAALQNGGSQAAGFSGLALGGLAIRLFGDAGGFALLTVLSAASLILMLGVELPAATPSERPDDEGAAGRPGAREGLLASIVAGARFGFGSDPLRTLLLLSLILGGSFSVMQISMPRVVSDEYERGPAWAGVVLGAFGVGMLVSSALVASRPTMRHGRNIALYIGIGLGFGQFAVSFAPNEWYAMAVMAAWGLNAGVAIASHRTVMQTSTPPEMMGRVMGLMMLGFGGALPIGAVTQTLLAPALGPQLTMRVVGAATMALTIPLTFRRSIIALR